MCSVASVVSNSAMIWAVAHQAPQPMEFSRQEYWSGLTCPPPGDLPNPGIAPGHPALQADSLLSEPPGKQVRAPQFFRRDPLLTPRPQSPLLSQMRSDALPPSFPRRLLMALLTAECRLLSNFSGILWAWGFLRHFNLCDIYL